MCIPVAAPTLCYRGSAADRKILGGGRLVDPGKEHGRDRRWHRRYRANRAKHREALIQWVKVKPRLRDDLQVGACTYSLLRPVMRLFLLRSVLLALVGSILLVVPTRAQCSDCFVQGSDLAPTVKDSQSDEIRKASARTARDDRAQAGDVTAVNAIEGDGFFSADLLLPVVHRALTAPPARRPAARAALASALAQPGLPAAQAKSVAQTVTGLLGEGEPPASVPVAVSAFNAAVDGASEEYLTAPPAEFLAVRQILVALYR